MADPKYITEDECKEQMNEYYKAIEDIVNVAETSLTSTIKTEIRHSEMRTKAYVDTKINEVKDDINILKDDMNTVKNDINTLKDDMNTVKNDINILKDDMNTVKNDLYGFKELSEKRHNELMEAIKSLKP